MEIKGFVGISLSDWDGKISSVIFLPNCNMRCPFCYNKGLVVHPEKMQTIAHRQVENYLETNRKWIDGVVITGGEPTLNEDLPLLCGKLKKIGFNVKIDTNGTNPRMISRLIGQNLVGYVALDVKAPIDKVKYSEASGIDATLYMKKIIETIQILLNSSVEYEFRTTLVPTLHRIEDIEKISQTIKGCKKYVLQNFKSSVETIDPSFQNLKPFSQVQMENFLNVAKKLVSNTAVRG